MRPNSLHSRSPPRSRNHGSFRLSYRPFGLLPWPGLMRPNGWIDKLSRAAEKLRSGPQWPVRHTFVSLHDVTPAHAEVVFASIEHLRKKGVDALTLLVIPDYHRRSDLRDHRRFCRQLLQVLTPRDEIALHGYYHLADRQPTAAAAKLAAATLTAGEGEFQALDYGQAKKRIEAGLDVLRQTLGVRPRGFVAPAWLQNDQGVRAIRDCGLDWSEDHWFVANLRSGEQLLAPALSMASRDPLRRHGSVAASALAAPLLPSLKTVRLAVHPGDYGHPELIRSLDQVLDRWLPEHPPATPREIWPCT